MSETLQNNKEKLFLLGSRLAFFILIRPYSASLKYGGQDTNFMMEWKGSWVSRHCMLHTVGWNQQKWSKIWVLAKTLENGGKFKMVWKLFSFHEVWDFFLVIFNQCAFAPLKYHSDLRPTKKGQDFFSFSQPLIHFTCLLYWSFKRLSFRMHVMYGNPLMMLGSPLGVFLWDTARVNVSKHLQLP